MKKIGLFGYGVVAKGFYQALKQNAHLNTEIVKICVKNENKNRDLDGAYFTTDSSEILDDPEIDIIVELIDDSIAAKEIVKLSLAKGKAVISANKKMIADNIAEVATWHEVYPQSFLYDAAVAGSIPIIQTIEQFFGQQDIQSIRGILNGSCNYILTAMRQHSISFDEALRKAQVLGFAESNPVLDISGEDALNKLVILSYHAFGHLANKEEARLESITNMEDWFYEAAASNNQKIKLIATVKYKNGLIKLKVQPELVSEGDELFGVEFESNAICVEGNLSGVQTYIGKGAGSLPTASAVINDLSLLMSGFKYQPKKRGRHLMSA
ncbi:MAG: homoserine dehydrogenase [Cyclobacteriaceae bacterium]